MELKKKMINISILNLLKRNGVPTRKGYNLFCHVEYISFSCFPILIDKFTF